MSGRPASRELDYDALLDGNVYTLYGRAGTFVHVKDDDHLDAILNETVAAAEAEEIGQVVTLIVSIDLQLAVDVGLPDDGGWALLFDDNQLGVNLASSGPQEAGGTVDLMWGMNFEEADSGWFIDPDEARRAVHEFYRMRALPTSVHWIE